ncbi:hypothetical protein C8R42DRAFT_722257 [Lentinula raphanica]|nr:hypothetical protein C8R42DRAFT_722257 [Lentinula raphanica]
MANKTPLPSFLRAGLPPHSVIHDPLGPSCLANNQTNDAVSTEATTLHLVSPSTIHFSRSSRVDPFQFPIMPTRFSPALILVLVFLALTTFPPEVICAPISVKRDSLGDEGLLSRRSAGGDTAVADLASSFIKAIPVAEKSLNALTEDGENSLKNQALPLLADLKKELPAGLASDKQKAAVTKSCSKHIDKLVTASNQAHRDTESVTPTPAAGYQILQVDGHLKQFVLDCQGHGLGVNVQKWWYPEPAGATENIG